MPTMPAPMPCDLSPSNFRQLSGWCRSPLPLDDPMEVCEHLQNAVTPKTRLLLIDHVTSPTALIFPIQEIVTQMKRQGILCLVDGAHAPGMVPLHLSELGADFYTGNCHKWLCAPKRVRPSSMSAPTTASIFARFPSAMEPTPPEPIAAAMKWSLTGQGQPILLRICASPLPSSGWQHRCQVAGLRS